MPTPKTSFWRWMSALLVLMLAVTADAVAASYTVQKGDTPYSIAKRHKVTTAALMAANRISDPTKLQIGQKLTIPSGGSSSSTKTSSPSSRIGAGKRVVIDPGHGGRDYGAYYYGVRESHLNLRVAQKLESYLKDRGYSTAMTRRSDAFVSLSRRAAIANRYRNAIFVSIHFNATRDKYVRGAETFYAGSSRGRALASAIQSQLVSKLNVRNRGVRYGRFTVLHATKCPAVLVECGFISNASERKRCNSSSYQSTAALAIADGIGKYRW